MSGKWREGPGYRVRWTKLPEEQRNLAPLQRLEYQDDQGTLAFWGELMARPRGTTVYLDDLPANFSLGREELARRIWELTARWGESITFVYGRGAEIPTPPPGFTGKP
jgi:hypothetical protein